jgi:hypothetical protein
VSEIPDATGGTDGAASESAGENTGPETLQPQYQYVWSVRYIDAAALRDENTDQDDLCDDGRVYYLNDGNMNPPSRRPRGPLRRAGLPGRADTSGDAVERYVREPSELTGPTERPTEQSPQRKMSDIIFDLSGATVYNTSYISSPRGLSGIEARPRPAVSMRREAL